MIETRNDLTPLSSGFNRNVYRSGDFVYKFDIPQAEGSGNLSEFENYQRISQLVLPKNWRLPLTSLEVIEGQVVIVQEYIEGEEIYPCDTFYGQSCICVPCVAKEQEEFNHITGLIDADDIIFDGTYFYVIDMEY